MIADRPWVRPHHDTRCHCWKCLPHVVHDTPHIGPVSGGELYAYPCGHLVATSNALQDADFAAGASHGSHTAHDRRITCASCP